MTFITYERRPIHIVFISIKQLTDIFRIIDRINFNITCFVCQKESEQH